MTEAGLTSGTPLSWEDLAAARIACGRAYAPYSRFRVGAALESADGRVFVGCNVENASYPAGMCAERVALGHAVVGGVRAFSRLAIVATGVRPAAPCGMCRQALSEFGMGIEVMSLGRGGESITWRLEELLPASFSLEPPTGPAGAGS